MNKKQVIIKRNNIIGKAFESYAKTWIYSLLSLGKHFLEIKRLNQGRTTLNAHL